MAESILVNNQMLSEYLKTQDQVDLEVKIKEHNSEVKTPFYRKPKIKMPELRERNGRPKVLQEEINLRNREELVKKYHSDIPKAMIVYLIGGYKDQWPTDSKIVANKIQEIFDKNKIGTNKSIYHGIKMAVGRIRLSKFGQVYFLYKKGTIRSPSLYQMNPKAFTLTPEEAIDLFKQPINKEQKMIPNIENRTTIPQIQTENKITKKMPEFVEEKQITINFNGSVTINFNR